MATFKTTFFFEGLQPNVRSTASSVVGWTETWYQTGNSVDSALAFAMRSAADSWIAKRVTFLHALYAIKWVRCSDVDNPRVTKVGAMGEFGRGTYGYNHALAPLPYNAATAAQVNCCVLADLAVLPTTPTDKSHHRRILLRGLPQVLIEGNIMNEGGLAWTGLVAFLNYVARGRSPNFPAQGDLPAWQIQIQNPVQVFQPISALTIGANLRTINVTAPLPGMSDGKKVAIRNVVQPRGVNRIWTVRAPAAIGAGGPYPLARVKFDLTGVWDGTGQANFVSHQYFPANQWTLIGLRNKHTGSSPFARTRGRRRGR